MKSFQKNILILASLSLVILSSCATSYQAQGWGGGYSEIKTAPDTFIVTFNANEYTSHEKAMKYVLMRASELTLHNGYKYFSVVSSSDHSRELEYYDSFSTFFGDAHSRRYGTGFHGYKGTTNYSEKLKKPSLTISIKCYQHKPFQGDVVDADYFLANNKKK